MAYELNTKFDGPLVKGAPERFLLEKLVKDPETETFYALGYLWTGAQLYVGPQSNLAKAEVTKNEVIRDGGTVIVQFNLEGRVGELCIPRYYNKPATVKYDAKKIELIRII